ncbi:hypothetical protein BJF90_16310 [Pseudonocardia sp. CNS-004]|nr:hypothetical protein BJF90_16310 [Pseudonocardia sp. CNS-004]
MPARRGGTTEAGPQIIATASDYVDTAVVFRQYSCPSCWTALSSAVVPADHPDATTTLGRSTVTAGYYAADAPAVSRSFVAASVWLPSAARAVQRSGAAPPGVFSPASIRNG